LIAAAPDGRTFMWPETQNGSVSGERKIVCTIVFYLGWMQD